MGVSTAPPAPAPRPPAQAPAPSPYWRIRRAPRYTRFGALGGLVGLVAALAVALAVHGGQRSGQVPLGGVARSYSLAQVVGYLGMFGVAVGVGVGLVVAFGFERGARVARRHRS